MEEVKLSIHKHPLLPITRFSSDYCGECWFSGGNIYGGYRCNALGCGAVFHRECDEPSPEIKHSSHPAHPLKPFQSDDESDCSLCGNLFRDGYICSICDFKLDKRCADQSHKRFIPSMHDRSFLASMGKSVICIRCYSPFFENDHGSKPTSTVCGFPFHTICGEYFLEATHTSHPLHPLKLLTVAVASDYTDEKCLLCKEAFDQIGLFHHCDVCNFSICLGCMKFPPPVEFQSPTTHEHKLHLFPRRIDFTCNACGTLGDRSPYFCLQCNFVIHRECIDLPRVININHHDHRISYTRRLGHGEDWKCRVCREKVDGFYGAYTCVKCPTFVVHSRCTTRNDVWDMIELEGTPDEEEIPPFVVIDANTIRHFCHAHNLLRINKDGHDQIQPENIVCEACRLQILSEPSYSCDQCNFMLHQKCANHPRKKRHAVSNLPFSLLLDSRHEVDKCEICYTQFTGFRYKSGPYTAIDVRCTSISDTVDHGSHHHPLYFNSTKRKDCSTGCGSKSLYVCDTCDYALCHKCVRFPEKVIKNRYDDHPLLLAFGEQNEYCDYWFEACEGKVNSNKWFYTCKDCGTILHTSCVVGEFSYIMPGTHLWYFEVVSNTSVSRPLCSWCNSRSELPYMLKISTAGVDAYYCSYSCSRSFREGIRGDSQRITCRER